MDFFAWQDANRKQHRINTGECDTASLLQHLITAQTFNQSAPYTGVCIVYYMAVVELSTNILSFLSFKLNVKA